MLIILPLLEEICRHQKEEKEEKRSIVLLGPGNPAHKGVKSAGIPGLFQDIAGIQPEKTDPFPYPSTHVPPTPMNGGKRDEGEKKKTPMSETQQQISFLLRKVRTKKNKRTV